jgi:hypothetical protein
VTGRVDDDRELKKYELNWGSCIKVLLPSLTRKLHNVAGDDILHPVEATFIHNQCSL